jgi:hypothetical protein
MRVALVNPPWRFEGSIYFGCREPHLPFELGYADALLRQDLARLLKTARAAALAVPADHQFTAAFATLDAVAASGVSKVTPLLRQRSPCCPPFTATARAFVPVQPGLSSGCKAINSRT